MRADRGLWQHELFGDADAGVHDSFSLRAAQVSDAALAASIFHYDDTRVSELKRYLDTQGIPVRL